MKYSFNTWAFSSYPNWLPAYPIEEVIRRLSVLGYDAVELGCTAPHAWPDFMDKQDRKALLSFVKAHNMVFSTLLPVTGVAAGANPASANARPIWSAVRSSTFPVFSSTGRAERTRGAGRSSR